MYELADTVWISYGVCQETLTDNLNTRHTAPSYDNAPAHTSLKTTEFVTNNIMVIIPLPPYSPDVAPCDFVWFPKLKMKLKGRRFQTSEGNHKRYSRVLREMRSTVFLKRGKNDGIAAYVPKETVLKGMAGKIE
jgi:hypothetical protein